MKISKGAQIGILAAIQASLAWIAKFRPRTGQNYVVNRWIWQSNGAIKNLHKGADWNFGSYSGMAGLDCQIQAENWAKLRCKPLDLAIQRSNENLQRGADWNFVRIFPRGLTGGNT